MWEGVEMKQILIPMLQAEQQAQQQSGAQQQEALNKFKNAFSSCIDARGYSVK
jgi:hypothetical protein